VLQHIKEGKLRVLAVGPCAPGQLASGSYIG